MAAGMFRSRWHNVAYRGQTYQIPFSSGGVNYSRNFEEIPSTGMVDPTKNINLFEGGRAKRGGTSHVNDTAISGVSTILGGYQFRLLSGTTFTMFLGDDGGLYKNTTTTIQTGLSTTARPCFETLENELYFFDGQTRPQTWDGAAAGTSNITTPAADWSGTDQPKYVLKHGLGASQRLWAMGVPGFEYRMYYSSNGDGKVFSGGTSGNIDIETRDGFGLVGMFEFGERLFGVGKRKIYQIEDSDASTANWGYSAAQWEGGAAHHWLIAKTPNDVICMMEDGEIYSVGAVQSYGDYKAASVSRPSFIHNWIKDNASLSDIGKFHCIYDPVLRACLFFVMRNGASSIDTALVYFIDRAPQEAWSVHDNLVNPSGYGAFCSFLVRETAGNYKVYTGGYAGYMWSLNMASRSDNDAAYACKFRGPPDPYGNARVQKRYRRGWLVFSPAGAFSATVRWWVDQVAQTDISVSTVSTGGTYGSGVWGTAVYGQQEIAETKFELGAIGKRLQIEIDNSNVDEDLFCSKIMIDHELIGPRAAA